MSRTSKQTHVQTSATKTTVMCSCPQSATTTKTLRPFRTNCHSQTYCTVFSCTPTTTTTTKIVPFPPSSHSQTHCSVFSPYPSYKQTKNLIVPSRETPTPRRTAQSFFRIPTTNKKIFNRPFPANSHSQTRCSVFSPYPDYKQTKVYFLKIVPSRQTPTPRRTAQSFLRIPTTNKQTKF